MGKILRDFLHPMWKPSLGQVKAVATLRASSHVGLSQDQDIYLAESRKG